MKTLTRALAIFATCAFLATSAPAQTPATGSIEGRILNTTNGDYLNNARVMIEGTTFETVTNRYGDYRFDKVPAGNVKLRVFYTGLTARPAEVTVAERQTVTQDFQLALADTAPLREDQPLVLDTFVVAASREMSSAAIAINEQRYSATLKNVVSADEFGDVPEGNVGEFAKFLPGVTISYTAADARAITVRGLPPSLTPVTVDGNRMASASSSNASRTFEFEQVSINNAARIELVKSATPDMPADSLGGTLNMVSKSAFEHSKAKLDYRAYLSINSEYATLNRSVGPTRDPQQKITPGFDLTYIKPVNKKFGFTITALHSDQFNPQDIILPRWVPSATATSVIPADNPALDRVEVVVTPKTTVRDSIGASLDWKFASHDTISLGGQWNGYDALFANYFQTFNATGTPVSSGSIAKPADWGPTYTHSAARAGSVGQNTMFRRKTGETYHFTAKYRHTGPVWKAEAGAFYSRATNHYSDSPEGFFDDVRLSINNVTVNFDQISSLSVPQSITTANAAGPVEWRSLSSYTLGTATIQPIDSVDLINGAHLNLARNFDLPLIDAPLLLKAGLDARRNDRDIRAPWRRFGFVGPDGLASTADDKAGLYDLLDDYSRAVSPYGFQQHEIASAYKAWDLYQAHPEYWKEEITYPIQQRSTNSRKIIETVSAAYVRGDLRLLKNRLWLVGGVRYERTENEGYGSVSDIRATYQQDANGNLVLDGVGKPIKVSTDPAVLANLQYKERGAHSKRSYGNYFPSVGAVFNITDKLLLRASFGTAIGRPEFSTIIPGISISDPALTASRKINVNNIDLKPWTATKYDVSLEYYFKSGGLLSVGAFHHSLADFFGTVQIPATSELLAQYGLDDEYLDYDIVFRNNVGDAKIRGLEFAYRQPLNFLPVWAKGVQVYFTGNVQDLEGTRDADFRQFIPKTFNWGVSVSRPKFTAKLNWNRRGRQQFDPGSGTNMPLGTVSYYAPRLTLDLNLEYRLFKRLGLFVNARNLSNEAMVIERAGPTTTTYSRLQRYEEFGTQYTVGVKGSF